MIDPVSRGSSAGAWLASTIHAGLQRASSALEADASPADGLRDGLGAFAGCVREAIEPAFPHLAMISVPREAATSPASRSLPPDGLQAVTRALAAPLTAAGLPLIELSSTLLAAGPPADDGEPDAPAEEAAKPPTEAGEPRLASLITTRARAYVRRIARGLTPGQLAGNVTVTAPDRSPRPAPDRRSTSSDDCRTRTRPPTPLGGRPIVVDDHGDSHARCVDPSTRGEDEV